MHYFVSECFQSSDAENKARIVWFTAEGDVCFSRDQAKGKVTVALFSFMASRVWTDCWILKPFPRVGVYKRFGGKRKKISSITMTQGSVPVFP